jgi:hypothetical protein
MSHGSEAAEAGAAPLATSMPVTRPVVASTVAAAAVAVASSDLRTRRSTDLTVIVEPALLLGSLRWSPSGTHRTCQHV